MSTRLQCLARGRLAWQCVAWTIAGIAGIFPGTVTLSAQRAVAARDDDSNARRAVERLLARRVTVHLRAVSRARAIDALALSAKVPVQYRMPVLEAYPELVTVEVTNGSFGDALERVLNGTKLRVVPDGTERLFIEAQSAGDADAANVGAATGTIVGTVIDSATRRRLGGASITVQGTKLSALSADSGRFTIHDVPVGEQVVTVRLFGYRQVTRTATVTTDASVSLRIAMTSVPNVLSGVVTTATGTQRKIEVGNDITTLNVDSIRQVAPITSVTDLLESRVPGLTVLRSSGAPGDPARLRLRGASSIYGSNDPIVIVDGIRVYAAQSDARTANLATSSVRSTSPLAASSGLLRNYAAPSPVDQIDPNSIETIEVFKGPSASSLYGSDAANGVIVITTKRGREGPVHWTTTVMQGGTWYPGKYPEQIVPWGNNDQSGGAVYDAGVPRVCTLSGLVDVLPCNTIDSVTRLQLLNLPYWSPAGRGSTTGGTVTVSGGAAALTYALTGTADTKLGYLKLPDALADAFEAFHGYAAPGWAKRPDRYNTWSGSGQFTAHIMPTMQLTLNSQLFHGNQQRSSLDQMLPALQRTPDTTRQRVRVGNSGAEVPIRNANAYERAGDEQLTFNNALTGLWSPWTWLPLTATAGLNVATAHDVTVLSRNIVPYLQVDTIGSYGVGQKSMTFKTLNVNTTVPLWYGRLRTALGFNVYAQSTSDLVGKKDTLGLGVTTPATLGEGATQTVTGTTTYGWFFEPRLNLSQRFFLTPGFRLDGGNANGGNASVSGLPAKLTFAALFPKVNFSWVALDRQEGTAPPLLGALTLLRPRLAVGSAGTQPAPGDRLRLVGRDIDNTSHGDTLFIQTLGNTQLRPERSFEVEGGIDAEAWHGRATMELTHSRKLTHDAIVNVPVAASVYGQGVSIKFNIGEIRNTTTEVTASIRPLETQLINWTIGGNLSRNDNMVLRLNPEGVGFSRDPSGVNITNGGSSIDATRFAVGYPLDGRWAKPILGYADANGDGIIQVDEVRLGDTVVFLGRQDPAVTAAVNTDLSLFRGRVGVHASLVHQGAYSQLNNAAGNGTFLSIANDPHATLGQQAAYVQAVAYGLGSYLELDRRTPIGLAQTVSYWRFQSLSLNYEVPSGIAQRFRAHRMSIALQGSNLALWTNYRGKDPNVNAFPNGNATADAGQLPQPRTWSLQLTLGN